MRSKRLNVSRLKKPGRLLSFLKPIVLCKHRRLILLFVTLFFALLTAVSLSLWNSFKHAMEQTQQRILFQSQLLERSITRTLESVESAMVSLDLLLSQQSLESETAERSLASLRQRVDEMIHFSPHIRQVIVTQGSQVLVDSAARSEGLHLDSDRLGLNLSSSNGVVGQGLQIISRVDQRFLPLIDRDEGSARHSVLVTGLRSGHRSETGDAYWVLVAMNPEYFTAFFKAEGPAAELQQAISLLGFDGEIFASLLTDVSDLPPVSVFLESGQLMQLVSGKEAIHAWSVSSRYPLIVSITQSQRELVRGWLLSHQSMLVVLAALIVLMLISMLVLLREVIHRFSIQQEMALLFKAVDQSSAAVILTDNEQQVVYVNPAVERLFGYPASDLMGRNPKLLGSGQTDAAILQQLRQTLTQGEDWEGELVNRTASGEHITVATRISAVLDEDAVISHFVGIMEDVTERKQQQALLYQQNIKLGQLATVFTHAHEGIMICCPNGEILDVNEAFCQITGYSRDEVIGQNPRLLKSGHQDSAFYASMWHSIQTDGCWSGEVWNRRKDGEVYVEHLTITAVRDAEGCVMHYVSLFSDISLQKKQEIRLQRLAHFDPLTGLPNRSLLHDRLQQAMYNTLRRQHLVAVVFIDLDGFKAINDAYGHDAGDSLLCFLAEQMQSTLRDGDTLARLGGDEFVAVLTDLADETACEAALKRLLQAAIQMHCFKGECFHVSASIGATFFPQPETVGPEQLLRQADQVMYEAKTSGKNQYRIFDPRRNAVLPRDVCVI
ncbi:MAG: diguanylate cyclase domain-containing protein [Nitrincola lacisaponensis]|uniref:diguanylate cyclase domain-containing protein n=1 Tax=Nitrincola lacisaponensis TaxID=267850 RepID=UPI00391B339A